MYFYRIKEIILNFNDDYCYSYMSIVTPILIVDIDFPKMPHFLLFANQK